MKGTCTTTANSGCVGDSSQSESCSAANKGRPHKNNSKHSITFLGAGILITSYNQAEIYIPSTRMTFALPSIGGHPRVWHTLTGNVLCGGVYRKTDTSCLELTESGKGWQPYSKALQQPRLAHSAWDSPEGIVLLGGYDSGNTSELVTKTNTNDKFTLKDPIR